MRNASLLVLGVCVGGGCPDVAADVTLPAIFSDHMVMQRDASPAVWGWESPGVTVRVSTSWGADAETTAGTDGAWMVRISTAGADAGPHEVRVVGQTTVVFRDVLLGEVWVCSGQSNMEWPLEVVEQDVASLADDQIRLFMVPNTRATQPRLDCGGTWRPGTPETNRRFSAVGCYFARELRRELDVPVGLISADWGGTVVQAWMSEDAARSFPMLTDDLEYVADIRDPSRRLSIVEGRIERWWNNLDRSLDAGDAWRTAEYDDADWELTELPASWSDDLASFDGIGWYRRVMELPGAWDGTSAQLSLGPIDDYDDVWVNGVHIGGAHQAGMWNQPRHYTIPAGVLKAGRNVFAVRVLDTGGVGGINGNPDQMRLRRTSGAGSYNMNGPWRFRKGPDASSLPRQPRGAQLHQNTATVLYNGMIAPIQPYGIRGAIWYQGESNRNDADQYSALKSAMIEDWRRNWNQGDFPFYYVQIAPFNYGRDTGQTAALREAQHDAMRTPNTGMVVTLDIGNPTDIHPKNKYDVGKRLALWALAKTYHRGSLVYSGPMFTAMSPLGPRLRLSFNHVGSGLVLEGDPETQFEIAGADGQWHPAHAEIDGDSLIVSSEHVERPVAVRYAWSAAPDAVLFNREGLPAAPFRTQR